MREVYMQDALRALGPTGFFVLALAQPENPALFNVLRHTESGTPISWAPEAPIEVFLGKMPPELESCRAKVVESLQEAGSLWNQLEVTGQPEFTFTDPDRFKDTPNRTGGPYSILRLSTETDNIPEGSLVVFITSNKDISRGRWVAEITEGITATANPLLGKEEGDHYKWGKMLINAEAVQEVCDDAKPPTHFVNVIAHELGHILGLAHAPGGGAMHTGMGAIADPPGQSEAIGLSHLYTGR